MTTSEPSPLDRVEIALAAIAESNAASTARLDRIEQLTESSTARLDRIERLTESSTARLDHIEQLTESNARAIAAHTDELRASVETYREQLTSSLDTHRAEFRGSIADVVDMIAENARSSAENSAQIQVLIGESRENSKQHQSFLERFDRILGEIRALWQRVLG